MKSQNGSKNLVQNASFEHSDAPVEQLFVGEHPVNKATGWTSPSSATPSLHVGDEKGRTTDQFDFSPKTGSNAVGIATYGLRSATNEADELREYVQGSISEALQVGRKYYISFWVHFRCEGTNNIGVAFSTEAVKVKVFDRLPFKPVVNCREVIPYLENTWVHIRDSFVADQAYRNFIIGNFFSNKETLLQRDSIHHHYAFIDDVAITEAPDARMPKEQLSIAKINDNASTVVLEDRYITPIMVKKKTDNPLIASLEEKLSMQERGIVQTIEIDNKANTRTVASMTPSVSPLPAPFSNVKTGVKFKKGALFTLDKVLFDYNSSHLKDESFDQLLKVAEFLKQNASVRIKVKGHTSSEGDNEYNQYLSKRRAEAVVFFIKAQGVDGSRLEFDGVGESIPVADNKTEEGRRQNRRVEFEILDAKE